MAAIAMHTSQASGGDSSSFINNDDKTSRGPPCRCGRSTNILKSWTDENPGRRFFRCGVHGFSSWSDVEEPHGWQKISLLEAREQIQRQKHEIENLKRSIRVSNMEKSPDLTASADNFNISQGNEETSAEVKKLEIEALKSGERETMLRKLLLLSWGGFLAATAIIITLSKK
ncbi:hypothetical protein N665_0116s0094 [Sinapis alba]|nr:hypothetical protein N665_0116s0094 [Sinapis alba]